MTPLTREEREAVLRAHPASEPGSIEADLDEYQALVAARFATDPSLLRPASSPAEANLRFSERRTRLEELHNKLFVKP